MQNTRPRTGLLCFQGKKFNVVAQKPFHHFHFFLCNVKTRQIHQVDLGGGINIVKTPRDEPSDAIYYVLYQVCLVVTFFDKVLWFAASQSKEPAGGNCA